MKCTADIGLSDVIVTYRRVPAVHHVTGKFLAGSMTALAGPDQPEIPAAGHVRDPEILMDPDELFLFARLHSHMHHVHRCHDGPLQKDGGV